MILDLLAIAHLHSLYDLSISYECLDVLDGIQLLVGIRGTSCD